MQLSTVIRLTITRSTRTVSKAGFGVPLILGATDAPEMAEYENLDALLDDFATSDTEYKMAEAIFGQSPAVQKVRVAKTTAKVAQVVTVTPTVANDVVYSVTINGVEFTATSDASATAAEIVSALVTAINAGTEPVTASGTTTLILTADTAGESFTYEVGDRLEAVLTTPNVGIASDVLNAQELNPDWYMLLLSTLNDLDQKEAAKVVETMRKICLLRDTTSTIRTSATTDIASILNGKGYLRTGLVHHTDGTEYPDAAWASRVLPIDPGAENWSWKDLVGCTPEAFTATEEGYLIAKKVNWFTEIAGRRVTQNGWSAGGEYLDINRGIDWIERRMQERMIGVLATTDKVPFTDGGIGSMAAEMIAQLEEAKRKNVVRSYTTTIPAVSDIDSADRANRVLSGLGFQAEMAGAVNKVLIDARFGI